MIKESSFRYKLRIFILGAIILISFLILFSRLYQFQIKDFKKFQKFVPQNKVIILSEYGPRGLILDRNNVVLANNQSRYYLLVRFDILFNSYQNSYSQRSPEIISKLVNEEVLPEFRKLGISLKRNFSNQILVHCRTYGYTVPFILAKDISREQFLLISENPINGIIPYTGTNRHYPYQALACHILGYVKDSKNKELKEDFAKHYSFYKTSGISGIEKEFDSFLQAPPRKRIIFSDINLETETSNFSPAKSLKLSLDARLQSQVEFFLRKVGQGAAIVMNPNNGEVLAMASVPNYDSNILSKTLSSETFQTYRKNESAPFLNRCLESFTPGSIFKVILALIAVKNDFDSKEYECQGHVAYGNHKLHCWIAKTSKKKHKFLKLSKAISVSCNPFFNKIIQDLPFNQTIQLFELFFSKPTGIEVPNEKKGIIPGSTWWRLNYRINKKMTPLLKAFLSIGQGDSRATPLQISAMTSCIANGGNYFSPTLLKAEEKKEKWNLKNYGYTQEQIEKVRNSMLLAVNEGTIQAAKLPKYKVAGKTGTAQVNIQGNKTNNAWVTMFAPYDNPRYVVTILIDFAESSALATILGSKIMESCFILEEKELNSLQLKPSPEYQGHSKINKKILFFKKEKPPF